MSAAVTLDPIFSVPSLEELVTEDFGIGAPQPLQRAICRIADGRPLADLRDHPHVKAAIGELPPRRCIPGTMLLLAAIRGGKSLISAAAAYRCAMTCDLTHLGPGDIPQVVVISLRQRNAEAVMEHLKGALHNSARLAATVVNDRRALSVTLRHPSGRPIEIVVDVGTRAGISLRSRWLVAVVFDECAMMVGSGEGVVNLDDMRAAVSGRLRPCLCANEWLISSPWAPFGPVYELTREHWGRPSKQIFVIRARGDWLNPAWWTPARIAEEQGKRNFRTDFLAEFQDEEEALFASNDVEACARENDDDLKPELDHGYAAEMDPAMRTNAFTLVVVGQWAKKHIVVLAREWRAERGESLDFLKVLREVQSLIAPYGIKQVGTDQFQVQALRSLGHAIGLGIVEYAATTMNNDEGYMNLRTRVCSGEVEIPRNGVLMTDLKRLHRVTTQRGWKVDLPSTADGRHCDFAPPLMRAVQRFCKQPANGAPTANASSELAGAYRPTAPRTPGASQAEMTKRWFATHGKKKKGPWWKP